MTKKVKAILIGLLAFVVATGAAIGITAQNGGSEKTNRSNVRVQNEQSEEANEANESAEENEANEQGETAEANETSEENEADEANETSEENEADEANETAETNREEQAENAAGAQLQSLAKITPEQAKSAALAQVSGTVKDVELEKAGGNVVYDVEIQTADGIREVKVDAGSGKVLQAESVAENDDEND